MSIAILENNELWCGSAEREILLNWINILFTQIAMEGTSAGWIICIFVSVLLFFEYTRNNFREYCKLTQLSKPCFNWGYPPDSMKNLVTVHSVHSNVAKIHSRLPAAMEFWLACLGILAYSCQNTSRDSGVWTITKFHK